MVFSPDGEYQAVSVRRPLRPPRESAYAGGADDLMRIGIVNLDPVHAVLLNVSNSLPIWRPRRSDRGENLTQAAGRAADDWQDPKGTGLLETGDRPCAAPDEKFGKVRRDVKRDRVRKRSLNGDRLAARRRDLVQRTSVARAGGEIDPRASRDHCGLVPAIIRHSGGAYNSRRRQRGPKQEGKDCADDEGGCSAYRESPAPHALTQSRAAGPPSPCDEGTT